ncbi:hypothetical protein, partial [Catellatospora sp. NPDC049133]|uniref:hypothetical protein n=1 Tax=Catellatospora sp. NPDC049133 TaxID=3155499 RepID=UPI0033F1CD61
PGRDAVLQEDAFALRGQVVHPVVGGAHLGQRRSGSVPWHWRSWPRPRWRPATPATSTGGGGPTRRRG